MQQQEAVILISSIFIIGFAIALIYQQWQKRQLERTLARVLDADVLSSFEDIKTILSMAQKQRVPFAVRKNGMGKPFNSFLVKTDYSSSALLIDSLIPEGGNELMVDSKFVGVEFFFKNTKEEYLNIPYTFHTVYLRRENYQNHPALRISFPESIKRNQRRDYNRVEPSIEEPIKITLELKDGKVIENMANISGGGVGFYTNLDKSVLWLGNKIKSVSFNLPDGTEITSQLIVRWVTKNVPDEIVNKKRLHFYCGAEFAELNEALRKKIILYIIEIEREELRRISKIFD